MSMLAVLYGSAFVAAFNESIVNVALVSIMGEFSSVPKWRSGWSLDI